jgi:hypothetical protein
MHVTMVHRRLKHEHGRAVKDQEVGRKDSQSSLGRLPVNAHSCHLHLFDAYASGTF